MNIAENAEKALRMVREAQELVYDTEGTGLDWRINAPIGYVVGAGTGPYVVQGAGGVAMPAALAHTPAGYTPGRPATHSVGEVVYVPIRHGGGGNIAGGRPMEAPDGPWQIHDFERELAKAFNDRNRTMVGPTIGHHLKFDAHFSANAGIMLGRWLKDTGNLGPVLNEYEHSYSLENSAIRYGVEPKKAEVMYEHIAKMFGVPAKKSAMEHFWRLAGNDPLAVEYAEGDGVTTLELYWKMMEEIEKEDLGVIEKLENDLIWTLFRMERKGIPVDQEQIGELRWTTERQINERMKEIGNINTRSPKQMKELFDEAGIIDYPTTEKGNPSFTEKWLKNTELGRTVIDIRRMTNLLNSFVNPLVTRHMYKGRVHATLNQLKGDDNGTISGRFSCTEPNLQQVPKRNKELAKPFRRLFIADEGQIFWERDWSQCEPRLFAHYSGDENLLDGYNQIPFRDAHQVVADLLDVERDPTAKRMNMGIFTGMQPRTFAGHMGWDIPRATAAHSAWFEAFPAVRDFQWKAKTRLKNRGYVFTVLGRKCRLEHPRFAYRGTSKIIQGSNADIAKYKLLEMDRACEENGDIVQVLMTVHDSFNGQREDTPQAKTLLDDLVKIMEDVQTEPFNLRVPFVAEGFEGPNWAIASFGEDKK